MIPLPPLTWSLFICLLVLDGGSSANTMTIDASHKKLEASTSGTENITDIQNYLDSFNKEIEGNEVTQVQTGKYYI